MTQTIEQLTDRVRELEEENARLKAECDDIKQVQFPRKLEAVAAGWKKQLAASQAYAEQLREALMHIQQVACSGSPELGIATEALAIPRDTSALDAYVADKVKEYKEDMEAMAELSHNNFEYVTELTQQRDLAVEAIEKSRPWLSGIADFNSRKAMRILETALYAIKESEGK